MILTTADREHARASAGVLGTYTAAVFLSALLLFGVQPMFTRIVLPQLGGSPAVWSVAMVFFQSMLLAGYAYAHVLMRARHRLISIAVHVALLCAAALTLPLAIAKGWGAPPASGTEFWLLGLFTISIGLPFFALAANNPLLQAWFVRTGHISGSDPYFLYAASNIGSFIGLLSYPILLEPAFTLPMQDRMWSAGFALLAALIIACGCLLLRSPPDIATAHVENSAAAKSNWLTIGRWVFVSAVPSGLLVAVTAHISTDVAAAPLLWVAPLAIYLLTWVLVFARQPPFSHSLILRLQPFAVAGVVALLLFNENILLLPKLVGHLLAFFVIAMACHGELARSRPAAAHLTTFYLSLSFGGMVGGLFAGLLAPHVFSWVAEYPILAVLAVLCRPIETHTLLPAFMTWPRAVDFWHKSRRWFWPIAVIIGLALILPAFFGLRLTGDMAPQVHRLVLALIVLSIVFMRDPLKSALAVALALAVIHLYPTDEGRSETVRSFFGVSQIYETPDRKFRVLQHGTTIHGAERLLTDDGKPVTGHPKPLVYYHENSAMAQVIEAVRRREGAPLRVAVVGLGAGSLACYSKPGEAWRFFEIDQKVIDIARDPKRFTFISSCAPNLPIVLGDARLTLAREPDHAYDLIVIDAYSSDAIPVHLATREAMGIYKSKLAPHGVVMMHISNRYLELTSVVVGIAAANDLKTWLWTNPDDANDPNNFITPSQVAIAAAAPDDIGVLADNKTWVLTAPDRTLRTWTDDYCNIAGAFWRQWMKSHAAQTAKTRN
jgi:hypothetical protein